MRCPLSSSVSVCAWFVAAFLMGGMVWMGCGGAEESNPDAGVECNSNTECNDNNPCTSDTCNQGDCSSDPLVDGASCQINTQSGTCQQGTCVATGALELCTGGEDEDDDTLIDCDDIADCACAPNCIEDFLNDCAVTNLLVNPGFEDDPNGDTWSQAGGFPESVGLWAGDLAQLVGTVDSIAPLEGSQMMQFQSTFNQPFPTASRSSERVQLLDASTYAGRRICGVANFTRVEGDEQTDTAFDVVTAYYVGAPAQFDGFTSHITTECFTEEGRCGSGAIQIESAQAGEWIRTSSTVVLPAQEALTALVMVRASENVYDDTDTNTPPDMGPELDGHFVDDVLLFVVPDECQQ